MSEKWECDVCNEVFLSKRSLIAHLKKEIEMAMEEAHNAYDVVIESQEQLDKLKGDVGK